MSPDAEDKLIATVASIHATVKAQQVLSSLQGQTLSRIDMTINGNGKPGLKQTVAAHEETLANFKKVFWIVTTPILAAIGTGLVTVAIYLIQHVK